MIISPTKLHQLLAAKLKAAGLKSEDADVMADVMVFADRRGIRSHGAVRAEYYAESILKGGIKTEPNTSFERTGPCSAVLHGDDGPGMVLCKKAMIEAIAMAKDNGVAVVGVRQMSHSGAISYYTKMAAEAGLIGIAMCQAGPMVVPYGGSEPFYGTNPISFSAPATNRTMNFDMATSVQAWGKILDMRAHKKDIPDTWAVDGDGKPTTDPSKVRGLLPMAGPKGYGLMMMVDVMSAILLGLPFGASVVSMYEDLRRGRNLGQMHIVINPAFFGDEKQFLANVETVMSDLNHSKPAPGFDRVMYPGEIADVEQERTDREGIDLVDDIYEYLISDKIYINSNDNKNLFAN